MTSCGKLNINFRSGNAQRRTSWQWLIAITSISLGFAWAEENQKLKKCWRNKLSDTLDTITKHATYEDMERIQRFADKFPDVVLCILVHLKDSSCWRSEKYIKWLIDRYPDEVPFNACRDLIQAKPVLLWIFAQRIIERLEFALNRVNYIERDPVLVEVGISGVTWHLNLAEIMPNHSSRDEIWNKTIPEAIIVQKLTNGVMKKIDENFPLELKRKEG